MISPGKVSASYDGGGAGKRILLSSINYELFSSATC